MLPGVSPKMPNISPIELGDHGHMPAQTFQVPLCPRILSQFFSARQPAKLRRTKSNCQVSVGVVLRFGLGVVGVKLGRHGVALPVAGRHFRTRVEGLSAEQAAKLTARSQRIRPTFPLGVLSRTRSMNTRRLTGSATKLSTQLAMFLQRTTSL